MTISRMNTNELTLANGEVVLFSSNIVTSSEGFMVWNKDQEIMIYNYVSDIVLSL